MGDRVFWEAEITKNPIHRLTPESVVGCRHEYTCVLLSRTPTPLQSSIRYFRFV